MKMAQRPRRSEDRMSFSEFRGFGDFHARPNGASEDAECPQWCHHLAKVFERRITNFHAYSVYSKRSPFLFYLVLFFRFLCF